MPNGGVWALPSNSCPAPWMRPRRLDPISQRDMVHAGGSGCPGDLWVGEGMATRHRGQADAQLSPRLTGLRQRLQ